MFSHFLAVVNNAAMKICGQVFHGYLVSSVDIRRNMNVGLYCNLMGFSGWIRF